MTQPPLYPEPPLPPPPPVYRLTRGPRRPFPGFWQSVLLCFVFLCGQFSVMIPYGVFNGLLAFQAGAVLPGWVEVLSMAVANVFAFSIVVVLSRWLAGVPLRDLAPFRQVPWELLAPMAMSVVGLSFLLSDVDNLVRHFLPVPGWLEKAFASFFEYPWVAVIPIVLVAPVTEEIMFRGIVLRGLLGRYPVWAAMLISSLLFAFIHLNPYQLAGAVVFGMVFAWWYYRTRSLTPCVLGHTLVNSLPFLLALLPLPEIRGYNALPESGTLAHVEFQPLWFNGLGAALAVAGLLWTRHLFRSLPIPRHPSGEAQAPPFDTDEANQ